MKKPIELCDLEGPPTVCTYTRKFQEESYVTGSGKRYTVAHTMIFCISVVVLKPIIFFIH